MQLKGVLPNSVKRTPCNSMAADTSSGSFDSAPVTVVPDRGIAALRSG
jgi:hypothetical protein